MFQCYNPVLSALEIEGVETVTEETSLLVLYAELQALIRQFTPTDVPSCVALIQDRETICRCVFNTQKPARLILLAHHRTCWYFIVL